MNTQPDREQFANVVSTAYAAQFTETGSISGRGPVMNQPQIVYDPNTNQFSWCSTLTPRDGVQVLVLEEGLFGDTSDVPDAEVEDSIYIYVRDHADDLWGEVLETIETNPEA